MPWMMDAISSVAKQIHVVRGVWAEGLASWKKPAQSKALVALKVAKVV